MDLCTHVINASRKRGTTCSPFSLPGKRTVLRGPLWVQAVWKHREIAVVADSARGEAALESRSLGLWGFGDASVHRWRRSDAADAATEQSGGLYQRGELGSGDRGLHRRTGPCRLGICRDDAGGDGTAGLSSRDAAEDLPLRLSQPLAVEPSAGTGNAPQYRADVAHGPSVARLQDDR